MYCVPYPGITTRRHLSACTIKAVTPDSPKWPQVAERLAARIRSGELAVGTRLPAQAELARAEGVSLKVLQKALARLVAAGAVQTRDSVGTFVAAVPDDPLPHPPGRRDPVVELRAEVADLRERVERIERASGGQS